MSARNSSNVKRRILAAEDRRKPHSRRAGAKGITKARMASADDLGMRNQERTETRKEAVPISGAVRTQRRRESVAPMTFKLIDLFSGAGGMSLGFIDPRFCG